MSGSAFIWLDSGAAASNPAAAGTAANLSANSSNKAQVVTGAGNWSVVHAPAANTQATASKAAVAGTRHICNAILATLCAGATAPTAVQVNVAVRDGASGAGTILFQGVMSLPATAGASAAPVQLSGLNLVGSVNTAMTIEFSAAGGANTIQAVSMSGYDCA